MKVLDLFAGPGGWDLGATAIGLDPLGIEWDDAACATREAAGLRTVQADVAELDPADYAPCDLLIASPPCQAWSMAGKREGQKDIELVYDFTRTLHTGGVYPPEWYRERCADERSLLVAEPLRWALSLRPRLIAWEQVPPVLDYWKHCAGILREEGYHVWTGILSAERYGVPQTRKRAILMASLERPVHPPLPTHQEYRSGEPAWDGPMLSLEGEIQPWVSMAAALGWAEGANVQHRRSGERLEEEWPADHPRDTVSSRVDRWQIRNNTSENAGERDLEEPAPTMYFGQRLNSMHWTVVDTGCTQSGRTPDGARVRTSDEPAVPLTSRADQLERRGPDWPDQRPATNVNGDPRIFAPEYRGGKDDYERGIVKRASGAVAEASERQERLGCGDPKGLKGEDWPERRPATVLAGDPRVFQPGGHHGQGEQSQNAIRVTPEEASTLQSFPAGYPWQGTRTAVFTQIGNAVPPLMAQAILSALLEAGEARAAA